MEVPFVDLKRQYLSIKSQIDAAVAAVIDQSAFIGGEQVTEFEHQFAAHIGSKYCISCANGTDAIEIALEALGIGAGDEVIVPAYTWVSTASAVQRMGATPVFVDVHPDYYTIDPAQITSAISTKTKAIIPVHFYGLPAAMDEISRIAKENGLYVIEDCAQAHDATIGKRKVGTFGDIATFSFYPGKNLGAYGDGGAILTNNDELAGKCSVIARLGQAGKHNHLMAGRNSRLDTLQAAILSAKLPYLEEWTARRRWVARQYNIAFDDLAVKVPRIPTDYKHVYHLYVIQVDERDKLKEFLAKNGIQTQLHYPKPLNQFDFFQKKRLMPVSDAMAPKLLSLPMFAEITPEEINFVIEQIKKFVSFGAR